VSRHKERVKEGKYGRNTIAFIYKNGPTRPVETVLRNEAERIKAKDAVGKSKIQCKHFCNCHNVPMV
jgi:hypothetical protein